jgi:predicted RNA polymerase sigma factor
MRLGRVLLALSPLDPEAHGLQALMELQASRFRARIGADGEPVRLAAQDRSRWDRLLVGRGLALAERAWQLGALPGPYALQAAIAACHARAARAEATDWSRIVLLYDALERVAGSPIVRLNRAVAIGMAYGAERALPLLEALEGEAALRNYHLLPAARADMLERLGRGSDAASAWRAAAALAGTARVRDWLLARAAALSDGERAPTS